MWQNVIVYQSFIWNTSGLRTLSPSSVLNISPRDLFCHLFCSQKQTHQGQRQSTVQTMSLSYLYDARIWHNAQATWQRSPSDTFQHLCRKQQKHQGQLAWGSNWCSLDWNLHSVSCWAECFFTPQIVIVHVCRYSNSMCVGGKQITNGRL